MIVVHAGSASPGGPPDQSVGVRWFTRARADPQFKARAWLGGSHGSWNGRGAIKTPVWAHATTANPTPPGPWEGEKPKGGGGSLDSEQRHTPRAAHVPLVMCGGLLVGTEVQGADSALATRTCPGRRSEPWWEGDKASGMLRCLITGASAGSRA